MSKPNHLTRLEVVAELRRSCTRAGSQQSWAKAHGVSPAYVSDVLTGRRDPGGKILAPLGLAENHLRYVRVSGARSSVEG